jgi:hypothetical protein
MVQAILPRELDAMSGHAKAENKGARPVKRPIEPGAFDIVVNDKKRELQAVKIQRDAHDLVAACLHGTAGYCQQRFRSVRYVRYGAQELAAALESLLFGTAGNIDQCIPGNWAKRRWRRNRSAGTLSATTKVAPSWIVRDTKVAPWKCPFRSTGLDPIVVKIIEALAGTMVENDDNKRRRLVEFKDGCRYGKFGKTKAYELIAHERIRAYKMGGKTMIDLESVDEYHASLPRLEAKAS